MYGYKRDRIEIGNGSHDLVCNNAKSKVENLEKRCFEMQSRFHKIRTGKSLQFGIKTGELISNF